MQEQNNTDSSFNNSKEIKNNIIDLVCDILAHLTF